MPAEWKLSPVRRRSQPRTVGPEHQAAWIDSRGGPPAVSTAGHPRDPADVGCPTNLRRTELAAARVRSDAPSHGIDAAVEPITSVGDADPAPRTPQAVVKVKAIP